MNERKNIWKTIKERKKKMDWIYNIKQLTGNNNNRKKDRRKSRMTYIKYIIYETNHRINRKN